MLPLLDKTLKNLNYGIIKNEQLKNKNYCFNFFLENVTVVKLKQKRAKDNLCTYASHRTKKNVANFKKIKLNFKQ